MLKLLLVCLFSVVSQTVTGNNPPLITAPFPPYMVIGGRRDGGDFPTSSAKLCLQERQHVCFTMPSEALPRKYGGGTDYYGLFPKAEPFEEPGAEGMVLFYASTGGGSGTAYRYALLRVSKANTVEDLLPEIVATNQSDHALWSLPDVSTMPVFLVADYIWEGMQAHYGNHRYTVSAYVFAPSTGRYRRLLTYETAREYPSVDLTDDREARSSVLRNERNQVLKLLRKQPKFR